MHGYIFKSEDFGIKLLTLQKAIRTSCKSGATLFGTWQQHLLLLWKMCRQLMGLLIKKCMIYSPRHGYLEFTVPLFDDFMRRYIPLIEEL
jgi:hypothetical protein